MFEADMEATERHADGKLLAGRIGAVGLVVLNQPEKRNAMSLEMWEGLGMALDRFEADDGIRAVVLAGAGSDAFCSGNDISQFAARRADAAGNEEFSRITGLGRDKLTRFPKPSIACIQGYCMGGGLAMALQADLRVTGANAVFSIPAARMGIAYGPEALERLVAVVGPASARLMIYSARRFGAREACRMGLVDLVAPNDPGSEALELAHSIAANAPLAVMAAKFTIDQIAKGTADRDMQAVQAHARRCMDSADYREARIAFMEKRQPVFVGA